MEKKGVCFSYSPHPILISESGRAITAHHSVLVVETLGAYGKDRVAENFRLPPNGAPMPHNMSETLARLVSPGQQIGVSQLLEEYHDVVEIHREAATLFGMGYLSLEQNALVERLYWSCCSEILKRLRAADPDPVPIEFTELKDKLVDQYLCDFSVFQSMLDHWAIRAGRHGHCQSFRKKGAGAVPQHDGRG